MWRNRSIFFFLMAVLIVSGLLALPMALEASVIITGKRVALVIGNSAYKSSPLKNPANDAHDVATALRKLNFEVIERVNVDRKKMSKAMGDFGAKLKYCDVGLFYYAGHGMEVKGSNYLIPIDAESNSESEVVSDAIDMSVIMSYMEDAKTALNIVILDACRDNPFARSFRSNSRGLARIEAPTGTVVAYATAPGKVAFDGEGRNGVYTKHLIDNIVTPDISLVQILQKISSDVAIETNGKQLPWINLSPLKGDFYFNPKTVLGKYKDDANITNYQDEENRLIIEKRRLQVEREQIERQKTQMLDNGGSNASRENIQVKNKHDCREILVKFSLGEYLSDEEKKFLQRNCGK